MNVDDNSVLQDYSWEMEEVMDDSTSVIKAYGDKCTSERLFKKALESYACCVEKNETLDDSLEYFVSQLAGWKNDLMQNGQGTTEDHSRTSLPNICESFLCSICNYVLYEPVTLECGHTSCKQCILNSNTTECAKCHKVSRIDLENLKVNIIVWTLVKRWWSKEVEAVGKRNEGNALFLEGKPNDTIRKYNEAYGTAPYDHLLLCNKSHLLLNQGKLEAALLDGERAISVQPRWAMGYYRRGMAQISLGQYEDAILSFILCLHLDSSASPARREAANLLLKLLRQAQSSSSWQYQEEIDRMHASNKGHFSEEMPQQYKGETRVHAQACNKLHRLIDRVCEEINRLDSKQTSSTCVTVPESPLVDQTDFECSLCFRIFLYPITTPCGHTFCQGCLDRVFDHSTECPLCKTPVLQALWERNASVTEFIQSAVWFYFPEELQERLLAHSQEMEELASFKEIPIFVCTVAFPNVTCPLHVFEPRYRLMLRRCMETGIKCFGMCAPTDSPQEYNDYGTMLEVRGIHYLADGRSVVDTVGSRRFKVLRRNKKDGYNTANVEFLSDSDPETENRNMLIALHNLLRETAVQWLDNLPSSQKNLIVRWLGPLPDVESDFLSLHDGPAWTWWVVAALPLDQRVQAAFLGLSSLEQRLKTLRYLLRLSEQRRNSLVA